MGPMTVTLDLPAEAQARLQAESNRRGITLDQLIAEIAASFPDGAAAPDANSRSWGSARRRRDAEHATPTKCWPKGSGATDRAHC